MLHKIFLAFLWYLHFCSKPGFDSFGLRGARVFNANTQTSTRVYMLPNLNIIRVYALLHYVDITVRPLASEASTS